MILITGATGTIGSQVVRQLIARGEPVRAMTRNPAAARLPDEVEVVAGDFGDTASLERAVHGATAVFALSGAGPEIPDHDRALIGAARAAGVRRVVKLSSIGMAGAEPPPWHEAGERAARESGLGWTFLRPSAFASNALEWAPAIRAGEPAPNRFGSGRLGVVDPRDVAEVAVLALTSDRHQGRAYTLTGPELISAGEQAAVLSAELGRPVTLADIPLERLRQQMLAYRPDPAFVDQVMAGVEAVRDGRAEVFSDDLPRVLGRPATGFAEWARDHRAAFTG
ncbi:SDR family oxidoreductase [Streptomyces orinoci]|uniref:SDR family oxidoreductase n=1 Tax=Streptomyces orinoci TaxID=67339 RepID=A0ABV3JY09_STRON|nr:SDR family oxidoreductase [Streptomyces orinoci]